MGEFVRLDVDTTVATIRLDRPPANAISRQVSDELRDAVLEAGGRDDVRAVVVWGGPKIFAAGADIKDMVGWGPEEIRPVVSALGDALVVLEEVPKVTIAAIEGYCLGGGCELALACDFRFAAQDATLGQPEVALGIIPAAGGTQRLPRLIGRARAKELIFTGRRIEAREAERIGLVNAVAPPAELMAQARTLADAIARNAPLAVRGAKQAINAGLEGGMQAGLALEAHIQFGLYASKDWAEGLAAFNEKRPPAWRGE